MNRLAELWARTPLSGRLALLLVVLGLGALAIGNPTAGTRVTLDTQDLAAIVQGEVDHVEPAELADWLIAGRQDFRLIDLRDEADFAAYHIPNAERIPIVGLEAADLARNEKIVLYSEEGIHSAQAWMLLKAKKYPAVYILVNGLKGWKDHVLYPVQPGPGASPAEQAEFAKAAQVAAHFGGAPRAAVAPGSAPALAALPAPATPAMAPPVAAPPTGAAPAKKKKEGC